MEDKPVREYHLTIGKVKIHVEIMNEPSPEAIKEFNKRLNNFAKKQLSIDKTTC